MEHMEEEAKNIIKSLKPIERLVPNKPPYIACGEYLLSKKSTRELPRGINFEHLSERSAATNYHFVRKSYNKIEDDLQAARINAEERRKSMDQQWKELYKTQIELRNSFIQFNEFMEQNEKKRKRASLKKEEMTILLNKTSEEVETLKKEYSQMKELKTALDIEIKQYTIFEKFLMEVAKCDKINFGSIDGIFSRYTALVKARRDLTDRHENYMQELERIRDETRASIIEKFVQLEGLSNIITDLQKRYEAAKIKAKNAEQYHQQAFLEAQEKVLELQCAKDSCWQIYEQICSRRNQPPIYKNNSAKQLEVIKKYFRKLTLVNRMVDALQDENFIPPTERESSGDSIVANVVAKVKATPRV